MDHPFNMTECPRDSAPDTLADLPLTSIAWRALRQFYKKKAENDALLEKVLKGIAEEAILMDGLVKSEPPATSETPYLGSPGLAESVNRIKKWLADLGLFILAPIDRAYDDRMMEYFDNIAQKPVANLPEPRIGEVITPAIIYRGAVLGMGKAVIYMPIQNILTVPGPNADIL